METSEFVRHVLLNEVSAIYTSGAKVQLVAAISHGIEVCGALLDPLPYKAKGQGRKRFILALRILFPPSYVNANSEVDLYGQLRSHISHCMLPGKYISVEHNSAHLTLNKSTLIINLDELYQDYLKAGAKLLDRMSSGEVKLKRINLQSIEPLVRERTK